jgi:hypothetical protein
MLVGLVAHHCAGLARLGLLPAGAAVRQSGPGWPAVELELAGRTITEETQLGVVTYAALVRMRAPLRRS